MTQLIWLFLVLLINNLNCSERIHEYVVKVTSGYSGAKALAKRNGMVLSHQMMGFNEYYVLHRSSNIKHLNGNFVLNRLKRSIDVMEIEEQKVLQRSKRDFQGFKSVKFNDPLHHKQWYLIRSQYNPKMYDMNVVEAWKLGYTGKGVVVSILDDGIDHRHTDLHENYDKEASYDINDRDKDPLYNLKEAELNKHGTRCAGEVSAVANNGMCGVGVAFKSKIGAVRMLDGQVTDRVEAEALSINQQHIDIYSASWGPDDDGTKLEGPNKFAKRAFERGVNFGRGGKGNIFVWASGNGGKRDDSCACDGYASSVYTFSVSSVSENNNKPWYLEKCASTLATTYSSGSQSERKIVTTDINNMCTQYHTGTSASAPLAAGIIALLLEANNKLTWRDVQYITVVTANSEPFKDGAFLLNGANRLVSNTYGFGLMDAGKMTRLGKLWKTLPVKKICKSSKTYVNKKFHANFKVTGTVKIDNCKDGSQVNFVEHVVLRMKLSFTRRGLLRIVVISPSGTRSEILPTRFKDRLNGTTYLDVWPLMTVQFWGELCKGDWSIEITNDKRFSANYFHGNWTWFELEIHGSEEWPIVLKRAPTKNENYDQWFNRFHRVIQRNSEYRTRSIPTEFTKRSSKKVKCHRACVVDQCTGRSRKECTKCAKYKNHDGLCVNECPEGTFLSSNFTYCIKCHYSCYSCTGPTKKDCTLCHEFDSFRQGSSGVCQSAMTGCQLGYFLGDKKTCKKCPVNCTGCINAHRCSICKPGFTLTFNHQCKPKCDPGSFNNGFGVCQLCPRHCSTCILPFNYDPIIKSSFLSALNVHNTPFCTSCAPPNSYKISILKFRDSPSSPAEMIVACTGNCPPGYIMDKESWECLKCNPKCDSCELQNRDKCTGCRKPFVMINSTCIDSVKLNCLPNEFKNEENKCVKCRKQCATCSSLSNCTNCSNKYPYQHMNDCVSSCPKSYMPHPVFNACVPCDFYCTDPSSDAISAACSQFCSSTNTPNSFGTTSIPEYNSTTANTTSCVTDGYFLDPVSSKCTACSSSCARCSHSSKHCFKCPDKILFDATRHSCVKKCPRGTFLYRHDQACIPCHLSCSSYGCDMNGKCKQCSAGHAKNITTNKCSRIITCGFDSFWNETKNKCDKCNKECRTCSSKDLCNTCSHGFCLDSQSHQCRRCCLSKTDANCVRCDPGSELCFKTDNIRDSQKNSSGILSQFVTVIVIVVCVIGVIAALLFYNQTNGPLFNLKNINNNSLSADIHYRPLLSHIDDDDDDDNDDQEFIEFIRHDKTDDHNRDLGQPFKKYISEPNENGYTFLPKEDVIKSNGTVNRNA